jgi:hypothetical protein
VELSSATGSVCTLTGLGFGSAEILVSAENPDTGDPVTAGISVQVAPKPIWAWDRARDGGLTGNLTTGDTTLTLQGRGEHTAPIRLRASGNTINYTNSGLEINSFGTGNSTRIMFGSNSNTTTNPQAVNGSHQPGDFDFLTPNRELRISVDYEIGTSAAPGRDMWLMVNNNQPTQGASILGNAARILAQPITAVVGTKATAIGYLNVPGIPPGPGRESLDNAFVGIICLSNGGRVFVSGIRIEYNDTDDAEAGE